MPKDLLYSFLKQYLNTDQTFDELLRKYQRSIYAIAFNPDAIDDSDRADLITKLTGELTAIIDSNAAPNRTYRTMLHLLMRVNPDSRYDMFITPHLSKSITDLRARRNLVEHIENIIHEGEADISDLYWVYLGGTDKEKMAIHNMLQLLPLEFPFIRFVRQMFGLVEAGLAPELFPTLLFRVYQESQDGTNPFETDEALADPQNAERLKGYTQGSVTQLRRRLGRILQYDHDNRYLLASLRAYPSDGTIAPTPLVQHLYGSVSNFKPHHRPNTVLAGDFANKALVAFANDLEKSGNLGHFTQELTPEVLAELETLSAKPLDKSFAFFVARSLMQKSDLNVEAILENAAVNPALYATLIHRWDNLSSDVQSKVEENAAVVAQQGVGVVKTFLQVTANLDSEAFIKSALGSASSFCPELCQLLHEDHSEAVVWKAMHTVQLTLWDKQRNIHGVTQFLDLNSMSLANVIVCAEVAGTHFSSTLRAAFEPLFSEYMRNHPTQPEVVYWLSHSRNEAFKTELQTWVQQALDIPANTKWEKFDRFILHYATGLAESFSANHDALTLDDAIAGTQFLDKAETMTNFDFFAFLRFSFRYSRDAFWREWNRLLSSSDNNYNSLSFDVVSKRNPKLFTETYEWHVRNEWRRLSERQWSLERNYNAIIPKLQSTVHTDFSNSKLTDVGYSNRRKMEATNEKRIDAELKVEFPRDGRSDKEFTPWREEVCQERHGMSYRNYRYQRIQEANIASSLTVLKEVIHLNAHKSLHTAAEYKQHLKFGWEHASEWNKWDQTLSIQIIQKLGRRSVNRWRRNPFPFENLVMPYDKENPPKKKTVNEDALWPWLLTQLEYKHTDNIGTCLKHLLESHNENSDITVSKGAIEKYMRHVFMHRMSLTQLQRYIKDTVIDNLAEHHKMFFFSWLAYLLRTGTSTVVVGRFLTSSHIPLKEVIAHRTIRRTAVMVRSMFDQIVRFLEDDDSPRSDRIFNLIMEVALDESEPKATLAIALVNLGFSQRIQNWIAAHPDRVAAFMNLHADWVDEPDWTNPFFPIYIAIWQNQKDKITRQSVISFLRKTHRGQWGQILWSGPERYAEGLMNCVVSHHPDLFGTMLSMITNPHPTPSEVIRRPVIKVAIMGLGRIRVKLPTEDRMLILEKLEEHYRREVLPLVALLTNEEWTIDLTVSILEAISTGEMRKEWNFIFDHRHDFDHWLAAAEKMKTWNWWLRNPLQQKLSSFPSKSYRDLAKTSPDRMWWLFNQCSNTPFFAKLIKKVFKTSEDIDTLAKIETFLKFGWAKEMRVHWALQFSRLADIDKKFEYLNVLRNVELFKAVLMHHFHLILPVYKEHTERFLQYVSSSAHTLKWIERLEETGHRLNTHLKAYPVTMLGLYNLDAKYQGFSYITALQGTHTLIDIERYLQVGIDDNIYINTELLGRWYKSNPNILVSPTFLKYVFTKNLVSTYDADILSLPDSVLENQAVIWEYLSNGSNAPSKPAITDWKYRWMNEDQKEKTFADDLRSYQKNFFMQLRSRMVHNEDTHAFLIEQTFWNANSYYLSSKGGYDLLKDNVDILIALAKRERIKFAIRFMGIFTESTGFFNERTFLPMLRREMLSHGSVHTLLTVLRNHVNHVANVKRDNAEREAYNQNLEPGQEAKTLARIPKCRLLTELNNLPKDERHLLKPLVREMIKEPGQYRSLFTEPFFEYCLPTLIDSHPRSMGAYLRRLPQLLETSTALQDLGPALLRGLPLYELKRSIHQTTTLFFYRGENPWREVLTERFEKEPKLKQIILEYALTSLSKRTTVAHSTLTMDLSDLKNPVMTWSDDGVFKTLPEKDKDLDRTMDTWTDDKKNEYTSTVSGWSAYSSINSFERTKGSISFYPWSGNFNWRALNSRRHVFKDGESASEFVHDMSASLKTKDGYTSSSFIRVQAQYQDRSLRFIFGEFQTQNVFEELSPAYCAYQCSFFNDIDEANPNSPASWGSWRRHSNWTHFTHHPLLHPHAQSLAESLAPLHGGYAYPNLDLSPEFALIESLWDDKFLDDLSTQTLMSLVFAPSICIQQAAKSALKLRKFKASDVRFVFELPENEWLWHHVTTQPMATLQKIWGKVLEGIVWEEPKRQRQVAWFLKTLYNSDKAEDLVQEIEAAILQGRGWITSPGLLYHQDFIWNAIQEMELGLKIRGLIGMAQGPLYSNAIPALEALRETVIGSLHILSQNIIPDAGFGSGDQTVYAIFNTDLENKIEDRVRSISSEELLNVADWQSVALHQKVGRFALKLTESLVSVSPAAVADYAGYLLDKVDEASLSLWIEHMKLIVGGLSAEHHSTLLNVWMDGMKHASLERVRSFARTQLEDIVGKDTSTHADVYKNLLRALSRRPKYQGMSADIYSFVNEHMSDTHDTISAQWIWTLVNGSQAEGHTFALAWLQNASFFDSSSLSVDRLVKLGLHNHDDIREWGLGLLQDRDIPGNELIALMPLLETGAFDVQNRIAERLRSTADLPLSLLLRLVDSTKSAQSPTAISVTELGKELLESHYGVDLNQDLVLQLSEHPTDDAEDYVASKLSDDQSAERLLALIPYFKRVLTRLNSGRATRDAILTYLREQSLAEQSRAESVLDLLEWMCHAHVVVDQLYSLETLALVQEQFPTLQTSIEL